MTKYSYKKMNSKGYITLLSVLVVGAIGTAITASLILLGLGSSSSSFSYQQMYQAKNLANSCAEEALEQIRDVTAFFGSGSLSMGQGSCTYEVANTGGESRLIKTTGTVGGAVRKTSVIITAINPLIIVSSWQEI
jgi:hypothetical protein